MAVVFMANASDPDEASERQNEPSCSNLDQSAGRRGDEECTDVGGGELGHIFVHHLLGSVLSENGVDEGVVDIAEDRDGSVDLGEFCVDSRGLSARSDGARKNKATNLRWRR